MLAAPKLLDIVLWLKFMYFFKQCISHMAYLTVHYSICSCNFKVSVSFRPHRIYCTQLRPVATDVTQVSPAKTAKPIEMPFGELTHVGLRNCVLDGDRDSSTERSNFSGLSCPLKSIWSLCCGAYSKRNHSILDNSMTCDAAFFSKFFVHLLTYPLGQKRLF